MKYKADLLFAAVVVAFIGWRMCVYAGITWPQIVAALPLP